MAQIHKQQAEFVLVAPVWKAQVSYPMLLNMLTHTPLLKNLIQATHPESLPQVTQHLPCGLSQATLQRLPDFRGSSWHHGGRNPPRHTTLCLENGSAGVVGGAVIPFRAP